MPFKGTLVNVATVLIGSLIGMAIGDRLSERFKSAVLSCLGLGTLLIGIKLAVLTEHITLIIASVLLGGIAGTLFDLEGKLERLALLLKAGVRSDSATFVTGFISASLLFCVGPMTVVGSIQDGTVGDASLLYTKSVLDGFASMALASGLGVGVLFAALTVLVVQGGLTLAGAALADLAGSRVIVEMSATGGLLIIAIGLYLLDIRKLPLANLLPAMAIVIPLTLLLG